MSAKSTRGKAQELIELIHRSKLKAPQTIVFGKGRLDELGDLVFPLAWGQKALVVTGARSARQSGLTDRIHTLLSRYTVQGVPTAGVTREPTVEMVNAMAAAARETKPRLIVSAGGGSVMDCAKALAALVTNDGLVEDYLEGVGRGLPVANQPLPHIAIPTVPGTGAEMTKNAVIASHEKGYKRSLRADNMVPTIALVDPLLTLSVPPHITASGGMDAITQLIESCISVKRRPEVTALAIEGLRVARQALSVCYEDPSNVPAREQMMLVSMLSGVGLANAGLAMAHGVAAALGAIHEVPHGLACGILLPHTLRYNQSACSAELGQVLAAFLNQDRPGPTTIRDGIAALESLNQWLQIPPDLKYLRLSGKDVERLAEASAGTSMAGNPIPMTPETTYAFLKQIA
jgi:alcohol dehydrogenase class IV